MKMFLIIVVVLYTIGSIISELNYRILKKEYGLLLEKYELNKIQWATALDDCQKLRKELEELRGEK